MIPVLLFAAAALQPGTTQAIAPLQSLMTAKRWDDSIALIEGTLAATPPDSYDRMFLTDLDAKVRLTGKNDAAAALPLFKTVVALAEAHPDYLSPKDVEQRASYIAHAYYQLAVGAKQDAAARAQDLTETTAWLKRSGSLNAQDAYMNAVVLYQQANAGGAGKVDRDKMQQALEATLRTLALDPKAKPADHQLLAAEYVALGEFKDAADTFERMVRQDPTKQAYWGQLFGIYNHLAGQSKSDPRLQRSYFTRAISAIERAQQQGFLKDPRNNYNLVTLYYTIHDYAKAAELLRTGLRSGAVEDTPDHWISLSYFDLQVGRTDAEVSDLKEAVRHFPDDSDLYVVMAQDYSNDAKTQEAFAAYTQAIAHGHFHQQNQGDTLLRLGYAAYELKRYDDALAAVDAALKLPDAKRTELETFKKGIQEAIHKTS